MVLGRNYKLMAERLFKGRIDLHKKSWSYRKKMNSVENSVRRLRRYQSCKIGSGQSLGVVQHKLTRSYFVGSEVANIGISSRK